MCIYGSFIPILKAIRNSMLAVGAIVTFAALVNHRN
jgi:hypothetical protein